MDFWRWISAKDDQEQEVLITCCSAVSILFGVSRNTDWESAKQVFDTVYTRVQVEYFGRENGLKKSTSTYIRENMRHTYRITKKCQNSLQQAKLRS